MEPLQLSQFELHIIAMCYLDYIENYPVDNTHSQKDREAIGKKLAMFVTDLPEDATVTVSLDTTQNGS